MEPRNDAIRAMASKHSFDLNFFSKDFKPEKEYNALFNSPEKPLFNRALNAYDPGSVWKIVTALAGLESGKFPRNTMLDTKADWKIKKSPTYKTTSTGYENTFSHRKGS